MKTLHRRNAFTLVELLTAIAIILLLIGILVPALSAARDQAKKTSTAALIRTIETGAHTFQSDQKVAPKSRGENPFEAAGSGIYLSGAQWLALQLDGADLQGYVKPDIANDTNADNQIDSVDWLAWYALTPTKTYARSGLYVPADGKAIKSVETLVKDEPSAGNVPASLVLGTGGSSAWNNSVLSFFVDAFGRPILYYAANTGTDKPYTTGTGTAVVVGKYDQADNAQITGSDGVNGRFPLSQDGWDLTGNNSFTGFKHPLGKLGYLAGDTKFPQSATFAGQLTDRNIFKTTSRGSATNPDGKIVPYKPDSFILISAGKDGLYGTPDDIKNFEPANVQIGS